MSGFASPAGDRFAAFARVAGATVALAGGVVLVGWALHVSALTSVSASWISAKANTAVGLVLAGASLWAAGASREDEGGRLRRMGLAGATLAMVIGLLTIVEYVAGWDLRIDQLLVRDVLQPVGTSHPGRMAPQTAVSLVLAGLALGARHAWPRRAGRLVGGCLAAASPGHRRRLEELRQEVRSQSAPPSAAPPHFRVRRPDPPRANGRSVGRTRSAG